MVAVPSLHRSHQARLERRQARLNERETRMTEQRLRRALRAFVHGK